MDNFTQTTLANINIVRQLTNTLGSGLKKSLGQNFLVNQKSLLRFINSIHPQKEDVVIEIGPGIGVVSYSLASLIKQLYLIEIDTMKEPALAKVLENADNYKIFWEDATNFDFQSLEQEIKNDPNLQHSSIKIIGSLPYNVSKRIIYNLLVSDIGWDEASFFLQKEVAESYTSKLPKADFLSTFLGVFCEAQYLFNVPAEHFIPIPKVVTGVIHLKRHTKYNDLNKAELSKFIKQGYNQPRKTIANNLKPLGITPEDLQNAGISPKARAGEVEVEKWVELFRGYKKPQ
jgi:16S rRNA (adenine1518-N6/adenine1519-N6)-dimethyltransferase